MASFADLVAKRIQQQQQEFMVAFSPYPHSIHERTLAKGVQDAWRPLIPNSDDVSAAASETRAAAVDGSRAVRAMNSGADWVIAQAHLIGQDGLRLSAADTILVRGEVERPAVDRCASLLMRSLELDLALKYAQSGSGRLLLLDGSLYADLPHLLYNLAIPGRGDLPLVVLRQYLDLFTYCQEHDIVLLGLAKSTRSTVLARAILDQSALTASAVPPAAADALEVSGDASAAQEAPPADSLSAASVSAETPTDGEILYRWATGVGYSIPILLGTVSFGHRRASVLDQPTAVADQFADGQLSRTERRDIVHRLRQTPAIGSFYIRLAPGEDALRVDALASAFGRDDRFLLDFTYQLAPHETALPIARLLQRDYGGASVYNAALFVVDREVRLSAQTVDHVYLSILRRELDAHVQYDRSTRRFSS